MMKQEPCCIWTADQRIYDIDPDSPLWKRLLFRYLYAPFVEFCFERLHFVPWDHKDTQGNYSFLDRIGVFTEAWRAAHEAGKHPHGFCLKLPLNEPLGAAQEPVTSIPSKSTVTKAYQRINERMVAVPLEDMKRLAKKLEETEYLA